MLKNEGVAYWYSYVIWHTLAFSPHLLSIETKCDEGSVNSKWINLSKSCIRSLLDFASYFLRTWLSDTIDLL